MVKNYMLKNSNYSVAKIILFFSCLLKSKVERIIGHGSFTPDKCVEINGEKYAADHILIATGGRPIVPNITGKV